MIAKLTGKIAYLDVHNVIIDVGGVGYLVHCPAYILANVQLDSHVSLFTEMQIKDETVVLYGFENVEQKQWFKLLTLVQGVGGKMALAILGLMPPAKLLLAISAQDENAFRQVSGIGAKLATRIINELKDKVANMDLPVSKKSNINKLNFSQTGDEQNLRNDVISALVNFGFNRSDSFAVVNKIANQDEKISFDELFKKSIAEMANTK